MENVRTYGKPPFHVAVIHGGPGAASNSNFLAGVKEPLVHNIRNFHLK
jgi:hypothetical protein